MSSPDCKRQKLADDVNSVIKMSNISPTKDSSTQTDNVTIPVSASNKESVLNINDQDFEKVAMMSGFVDRTLLIEELLRPVELLVQHQKPTNVMMFAPSKFGKTINLDMIRLFCDIEDKNTKTKENVTKNPTMQELRTNPSKNMKVFLRQFGDTKYEECLILKREKFFVQHFGRHPVVLFNFKTCRARNESEAIYFCALQVKKGYRENKYLENSEELQSGEHDVSFKQTCTAWINYTDDDLESLSLMKVINGLENLIRSLRIHWRRKPVFLVDEVDKPCVYVMEKRKSETEVREVGTAITDVLSSILKSGGNGDEQLELQAALVTGICRFKNSGLSAAMNNTLPSYFLSDDRFSKYYGLTSQEVDSLAMKFYGSQGDAKVKEIISEINANYNGYYQRSSSGENKEYARYCLFSVLNYIEEINKGTYQANLPFWSDGGFLTGNLLPILKKSDFIMCAIHTLLCDNSGTIEIDYEREVYAENLLGLYRMEINPNSNAIFNFLLQRGYLAHNLDPKTEENEKESEKEEVKIYVKIPNREVKNIFRKMFKLYHSDIKEKFISCGQIFKSLPTKNSTELQNSLNKFCEDLECVLRDMKCENEASICCHISSILTLYAGYEKVGREYAVQYFDNDRPCRVYIDVWGRHGNFAVIFEVKYNSAASGEPGKIGYKTKSSLAAAEDIVELLPGKKKPEDGSSNKAGTGRDLKVLESSKIEHYVLVGLAVDRDYTTHILAFQDNAEWKNVIQCNPENHVKKSISKYLKLK